MFRRLRGHPRTSRVDASWTGLLAQGRSFPSIRVLLPDGKSLFDVMSHPAQLRGAVQYIMDASSVPGKYLFHVVVPEGRDNYRRIARRRHCWSTTRPQVAVPHRSPRLTRIDGDDPPCPDRPVHEAPETFGHRGRVGGYPGLSSGDAHARAAECLPATAVCRPEAV